MVNDNPAAIPLKDAVSFFDVRRIRELENVLKAVASAGLHMDAENHIRPFILFSNFGEFLSGSLGHVDSQKLARLCECRLEYLGRVRSIGA